MIHYKPCGAGIDIPVPVYFDSWFEDRLSYFYSVTRIKILATVFKADRESFTPGPLHLTDFSFCHSILYDVYIDKIYLK
jgi:hypothetical protein